MTRKFASIELARLYEAQGYLKDALAMYRQLDDDVLEGGAEIRAAVRRLELALLREDDTETDLPELLPQEDPAVHILTALGELGADPDSGEPVSTGLETDVREIRVRKAEGRSGEAKMAELMENWLALMVVRKRLQLFKRIRSRL